MRKLRSLKNEIYAQGPRGKCRTINQITSFIFQPIGCNVLDRDFKITFPSVLSAITLAMASFQVIYTVSYYAKRQPMICLETLILVGVIVPVGFTQEIELCRPALRS